MSMQPYAANLKQAGYRMTAARRAVAHVLAEAEHWLNPEEILARGQTHCPSLGLVTVYRTLALFTELGLVRRVHAWEGCHGYVAADFDHGHHIVCRGCRQVIEFPGTEDLAPLINAIQEKTGFVVEDHMLELHGLCPACRKERETHTASRPEALNTPEPPKE